MTRLINAQSQKHMVSKLSLVKLLEERLHSWHKQYYSTEGSNDLIVIKLDDDNVLNNDGDIAECMNEYFASVFTAENLVNFPSFDQVIKGKDLSLLHCSPEDVSKILTI